VVLSQLSGVRMLDAAAVVFDGGRRVGSGLERVVGVGPRVDLGAEESLFLLFVDFLFDVALDGFGVGVRVLRRGDGLVLGICHRSGSFAEDDWLP
jgi:hypothetical protein